MEYKLDSDTMLIAVDTGCAVDEMPAFSMTYSPWQQWDAVYDAEVALCRGTIFPCLDKPFLRGACPCA